MEDKEDIKIEKALKNLQLLSIHSDTLVEEFAMSFKSGDVSKLGILIFEISCNYNSVELVKSSKITFLKS